MGRGARVGDVITQLTDSSSRGVLIVGAHGSGKTWMLRQVLTSLGNRAIAIRLSPSQALQTIPFGAVNARVGTAFVRSGDYYEVLNALLSEVAQGFETAQRVLLVVDNGEYLDEQSAAVIMQVILSTNAKLLLVDDPTRPQAHLRELWRDGQLARYEINALHAREVQLFLEGVLDGTVATAVAEYLASRSGGNPLLLKGLVSGALEEGALRKVDGTWVLAHPSDGLGRESQDYLRTDLEFLPDDSLKVLEVLALAGPLPLEVLLKFVDSDVLDELQQKEIIRVASGSQLTLELSRPATAAPIRSLIPIGRSRKLLHEITEFYSPELDGNPESVINFTRWAIESGVPVSQDQLLLATRYASQQLHTADVLLFTSQEVEPHHHAEQIAHASLAHTTDNANRKAQSLALDSLELASHKEAGALALRSIHRAFLPEESYSEKLQQALEKYRATFGDFALTPQSEHADAFVHLIDSEMKLSLGHFAAAEAQLNELLAHPQMSSRVVQSHIKSLLAEICCALGKTRQATVLAGEVISELEGTPAFNRPDISMLAYARAVSAFIYDAQWSVVQASLEPEVFVNPFLMLSSGGMKHMGIALMNARRGFIEEALSQIIPAVAELHDYDPLSVLPTALGLLAYCKVMHGDLRGALEPLERLDQINVRSSKFYAIEGQAYAAATRALTGDRERGVKELWALENECSRNGWYGSELTVLSLLIRVGESAAAARLEAVSKLIDCSAGSFYEVWAKALQPQDAASMEQAGTVAVEHGYDLVAVELAAHAQRKFHDRGDIQRSRRTASKVVTMREAIPGIGSPIFATVGRAQMTRRENEIAVLVARGESNNDIAAKLNVSLRTVEGHLYRTFIKLDLHSRAELAELINNPQTPRIWSPHESMSAERLGDGQSR